MVQHGHEMLDVLGDNPFRADVLARGGLDDWEARGEVLTDAEQLMADAVGAEVAFFSTCGSSLSVRAAMMAVAGGSRRAPRRRAVRMPHSHWRARCVRLSTQPTVWAAT